MAGGCSATVRGDRDQNKGNATCGCERTLSVVAKMTMRRRAVARSSWKKLDAVWGLGRAGKSRCVGRACGHIIGLSNSSNQYLIHSGVVF